MKPSLRYSCAILALIMMTAIAAKGTTVTATLQDPAGQVLSNTFVRAEFIPAPGTSGSPIINPVAVTTDAAGTFTITLTDVNTITPHGATWTFTVCPNATVNCSIISKVVITGTTQNISTILNTGIPAISVNAQTLVPKAFSNTEVPTTDLTNTGAIYWNTLDKTMHLWDGTTWTGVPSLSGTNNYTGLISEAKARIVQIGLLAEYNFQEGTGTIINDVSGNGRTATLNSGSWTNGGVVCNGTSTTITLPADLSTKAQSVVIFTKYGPFNAGQQPSQLNPSVLASTDANGIFIRESYKVTDASSSSAKMNGAPAIMQGGITKIGTFEPTIGYHMLTVNFTTPQATIFVDDTAISSYYISNGITIPSAGTLQLCGSTAMAGSFWGGTIYYALFYDHPLTLSTEVSQDYRAIRDYLFIHGVNMVPTKLSWGRASRGILSGDSMTENNYAQYMGTLDDPSGNGWATTIDGVSGAWPLDVQANIPWREALLPINNGARCYDILWIGSNMINGGATVGDTFSSILGTGRTMRQNLPLGCKLMLGAMIDRTGFDGAKNSLNALARTRYAEVFDWFIDYASDPNLGCDGCSTNLTYFQDGVHPTLPVGETLIANLATNAVNAVFGTRDPASAQIINASVSPYSELPRDMYINVDPTSGNVIINLPDPMGYTADPARCIHNVAMTSPNTVTINNFGGAPFDTIGQTSFVLPNGSTTCFVSKLNNPNNPLNASTWYRQFGTQNPSIYYPSADFIPNQTGVSTPQLGNANAPWKCVQIGTSSVNRSNICTTATAARAVNMPDAGGTLMIAPAATTTGRAACIKGTGQIGYCSTAPDATGACTCN